MLSVMVIAALLGCGAEQQSDTRGHGDGYALYPKLPHVTGHIDRVDPQPDNPRYFSVLLITDANHRQWQFTSEGWVGVSVGHLKDHQIQGATVTIWYEELSDGLLLARFVGD